MPDKHAETYQIKRKKMKHAKEKEKKNKEKKSVTIKNEKNKIKNDDKINKYDKDNRNNKDNKDKKEEVALTKTEEKDLLEQQKELETIKQEIKEETTLPKDEKKKLYKGIFTKTLFSIFVVAYFIQISAAYSLMQPAIFIRTLKICSMISVIFTIIVYEYAYRKDSDKYAINGIECMLFSICTIISLHIYRIYDDKFTTIITIFGLLFIIYYLVKSIVAYAKEKRKIKQKIIEKEKEETR